MARSRRARIGQWHEYDHVACNKCIYIYIYTSREERSGVRYFVTSSFTQSNHQTLNDKCSKTSEISLNIYTYIQPKSKDLGDVRDKGSSKMVTEGRCDNDKCEKL